MFELAGKVHREMVNCYPRQVLREWVLSDGFKICTLSKHYSRIRPLAMKGNLNWSGQLWVHCSYLLKRSVVITKTSNGAPH